MVDFTLPPGDWVFVKDRGALAKVGRVFHSADKTRYLRTGSHSSIASEATFLANAFARGFPIPRVINVGELPDGRGYFLEESVGDIDFAALLSREYAEHGFISEELFQSLIDVALAFFAAQIAPTNRQSGESELIYGIQLANVLAENPDIPDGLLQNVIARVERITAGLPLVLTHGDLTPFNILPGGVIDFEQMFLAPAGYDMVRVIAFQRLWDFPRPDGTGTYAQWEFSPKQIATFLTEVDRTCAQAGLPSFTQEMFDGFLTLNAIWALCFERTDDAESPQFWRWQWRKKVALYCVNQFLAGKPLEMWRFREIGFADCDS